MPKFDPEGSDISLYILMFERQARKLEIKEEDWVSHLVALLPMDIVQIIMKEPEDKFEDFQYIKKTLLQRFKLSPEAFRIKFVQHSKKGDILWKDYAYELKNYLEEWVKGVKVTDFDCLLDLMLTDQIKRRVGIEVKEHFVDEWADIKSSVELTQKLDAYELVRHVSKKPASFRNAEKTFNSFKNGFPKRGSEFQRTQTESKNARPSESKIDLKISNPAFEKRRVPRCFECNSDQHLRPNCPRLLDKKVPEKLNQIRTVGSPNKWLTPFIGKAKVNGQVMPILRDTGATIDLISKTYVKTEDFLGETVAIKQPLDKHVTFLPLAKIDIELENVGKVSTKAGVIGADLDPGYYLLSNRSAELLKGNEMDLDVINAVVTRSKSKQARDEPHEELTVKSQNSLTEINPSLLLYTKGEELKLPPLERSYEDHLLKVEVNDLITAQKDCHTLKAIVDGQYTERGKAYFENKNGLWFRITQDHLGNMKDQLLIPKRYRQDLIKLCHEGTSAHLGVTKTKDRVLRYYYWPNCYQEIEKYVRFCDPCQKTGKPGEKKKAPMKLVPVVSEIFSRINIDACGPLPVSSNGNKYLITVMCMSSKYPDAIPVADISSTSVIDALLQIFSRMGFPKEVQCDQGTSFTSHLTSEFFSRFGIKVSHSSVHHPQSNPVERFHRTIKRLLKVLCLEAGMDWERHLPSALLALRTITHASTGFSPAELVHGKNLRTPEALLYEHWVKPQDVDMEVTEYVFNLINRLKRCQEVAVGCMEKMQKKNKLWYDKNAVKRMFKKGDAVLVFATSRPNKLAAQWLGPGIIESQISETNYIVSMPGKKERAQIYHINMLKPYYRRPETINLVVEGSSENMSIEQEVEFPYFEEDPNVYDFQSIQRNSELKERLEPDQVEQLRNLLDRHASVFSNDPGKTDLVVHDVELVNTQPIRSRPYRTSPRRTEILRREIQRMLDLGVIEIGESDYTSPLILVEAPGKDPRPCIDYRRLNEVIRTEYFPLPNVEERVERVSTARFVTLLDMAKGYWQIPLSPRAQRIAAFVTTFGTYRPLRMPFGLKNAPYFFSKLMASLLRDCEDFAVPYLDDIAVYSDTWEKHVTHLECVLKRIKEAKLVIKPSKCKFAMAHVQYLGHIVGSGVRSPAEAKIKTILDYPQPKSKTQLRAFLGLVGYYGHYVPNFSIIAAPLTNALKGKTRKGTIVWSEDCENAFCALKQCLTQSPVLHAPNFEREFLVQTDASDVGIGVILAQEDEKGNEHPVLYLSKKFSEVEKRYSTTEKECAGIIYAIKKLHHYLDGQKFIIVTDHNPLVWLKNNAGANPRLMRWSLALQPYHFQVVHKAGKKHQNADCLSRIGQT